MTPQEFRFVADSTVEELVGYLMADYAFGLSEAFSTLYGSKIYGKFERPQTGLYLQSPSYIYEYLKEEMAAGEAGKAGYFGKVG